MHMQPTSGVVLTWGKKGFWASKVMTSTSLLSAFSQPHSVDFFQRMYGIVWQSLAFVQAVVC
jgi:hypothetical protein